MPDLERINLDWFTTSELTNTSKFQPITPVDENKILRYVGTQIFVLNDAPFTDINLKLYSNSGNSPRALIATSTYSISKTQMFNAAIGSGTHGKFELVFAFDFIPLRKGEIYHLVLNGTGYTGNTSSYVAWIKGYPNPPITTGITVTFNSLFTSPYYVYCLGADF